jgi:hypothetical protein
LKVNYWGTGKSRLTNAVANAEAMVATLVSTAVIAAVDHTLFVHPLTKAGRTTTITNATLTIVEVNRVICYSLNQKKHTEGGTDTVRNKNASILKHTTIF